MAALQFPLALGQAALQRGLRAGGLGQRVDVTPIGDIQEDDEHADAGIGQQVDMLHAESVVLQQHVVHRHRDGRQVPAGQHQAVARAGPPRAPDRQQAGEQGDHGNAQVGQRRQQHQVRVDLPDRQHRGRERSHAGQHGALAARIGAAVQAEREEIRGNRQPADRGDGQPAEPFVVQQQLERPGVVMQATQVEHHRSREEQAVDGFLAAHRPHAQREQAERQEHGAGQVRQVLLQPAAQLVAPAQLAGGADPDGR
ncbi:Uncharacterised protein [Bordetella pertussis]|nr:Uncharacterised protein [Bordetella pertussis]CFN67001.1 Uncharacterised protein [Bordetella pertussis]CPL04864.1 Uncharacterised protein [Bordetella pertussis]CPP58326.1 Uncharacterised protein [Bordetella pertussis]CRE30647.1 Uncharacterised protein [Bordetella pertussis]